MTDIRVYVIQLLVRILAADEMRITQIEDAGKRDTLGAPKLNFLSLSGCSA